MPPAEHNPVRPGRSYPLDDMLPAPAPDHSATVLPGIDNGRSGHLRKEPLPE